MESPNHDLVTIAEVDSQSEFLVVRSLLESAGIDCSSPDLSEYHIKGRRPSFTVIRLQVHASQADDAVAVLKDAEAHPIPAESEEENEP